MDLAGDGRLGVLLYEVGSRGPSTPGGVDPLTGQVPPRWFFRPAWSVHRGVYRLFGGRVGLWRPRTNGWGTQLTTTRRRTGRQCSVIIGYLKDGPKLVSLAMNGWGG
jgi:F420H(2)-dependent quinone reductase